MIGGKGGIFSGEKKSQTNIRQARCQKRQPDHITSIFHASSCSVKEKCRIVEALTDCQQK